MNITIPIECSEGHQYLLKFTDCKSLPIPIDIEVIDITLSLTSENDIINNSGTLNKIASIIFNFLDDNDVILYFYCSKDYIKQRGNRKITISNQQYRSILFSRLFEKVIARNTEVELINKSVILRDELEGDHYLHFISRSIHNEKLSSFENCMNDIYDNK